VLLFELLKERQSEYSHEVDGVFMIRPALYFPKREVSIGLSIRLGNIVVTTLLGLVMLLDLRLGVRIAIRESLLSDGSCAAAVPVGNYVFSAAFWKMAKIGSTSVPPHRWICRRSHSTISSNLYRTSPPTW